MAATTVGVVVETLLAKVDTARVLAASAALQMDVANALELLVLQRLSLFAARQPTDPGKRLSSSAVRRLLKADDVGGEDVLVQLDPFEGFPVSEVLVPPAGYLVPFGLATAAPEVADRLLRAVIAEPHVSFPKSYRNRVLCAARFLLGLSDTLCRRFDRSPGDQIPELTRKVDVPSATKLAALSDLVVFSRNELFAGLLPGASQFVAQHFLQSHGESVKPSSGTPRNGAGDSPADPPDWVKAMGTGDGSSFPWEAVGPGTDGVLDDGILVARPLVETHLGVVVAAPTELAATLRHFIIIDAINHGCLSALVEAVARTAITDVCFWLDTITDSPLAPVEPSDPAKPARLGVAADAETTGCTARLVAPFDEDKMIDVRLIVDDLRGYDRDNVWGHSHMSTLQVPPLGHPAEKTLVVNLQFGLGRDWGFLSARWDSPAFQGVLEDLMTVFNSPGTDAMTLWYFADAYRRLNETTQVMTFSTTDVFSVYLDHRESFYMSDDPPAHLINIVAGTGQDLREHASRTAGPLYMLYGDGVVRAVGCHGGSSPVSTALADPRVCFANMDSFTIWVRCRRAALGAPQPELMKTGGGGVLAHSDQIGDGDHGMVEHHVAQSIAYWLWQLYLAAPDLFAGIEAGADLFVDARMRMTASALAQGTARGAEKPPRTVRPNAMPVGVAVADWVRRDEDATVETLVSGRAARGFVLNVRPPSPTNEHEPPNARDRTLVAALIDGLIDLTQATDADTDTDGGEDAAADVWLPERRADLLEKVAPPGHKQLTHTTSNDDPLYWPGNLPSAVRVRDAAVAFVLDSIGTHLADAGFKPGPITDVDRTGFLNKNVTGFLIDWLTSEVQRLDTAAALPALVTYYEALMHESAVEAHRLPSQMACFGEQSGTVKDLQRNQRRTTETSIGLRFLIEYISATRPTGTDTLTRETTDLLLALAAEIVNKGFLSDILRFGLGDHAISVLRSGRLGINRDEELYSEALAAFASDTLSDAYNDAVSLARQVTSTVPDATAELRGGRETDQAAEGTAGTLRESWMADLDQLADGEYGFTYSQLGAVCGALIDASCDLGQEDLGVMTPSAVLEVVRDAVGPTAEEAQRIVDALTLTPLDDFWGAGTDVFPWRFNRNRSYLRQPLILAPNPNADESSGESGMESVISFGHRNMYLTPQHWLERHLSGRLQARSRPMTRAINEARNAKGIEFEGTVATRATAAGATAVRRRFKKVGLLDLRKVDGKDLGDVDVLVVTKSGAVLVIEAKAFEVARTPRELANEVGKLVSGTDSAVDRVQARAEVLKKHRRDVETLFGLPDDSRRQFKPMVVTDRRLLASYLNSSTVPMLSLDDLDAALREY